MVVLNSEYFEISQNKKEKIKKATENRLRSTVLCFGEQPKTEFQNNFIHILWNFLFETNEQFAIFVAPAYNPVIHVSRPRKSIIFGHLAI